MPSSAYARLGFKRAFDVVLASVLLAATLPVMSIAAVALLASGANPIFTQVRVGRHRTRFNIYKFRTMKDGKAGTETTVTTADDARITRLGWLLRRSKLDELPQLVNVLNGTMSFVGPRPDVPEYADLVPPTAEKYFSVRPGITGPATLKYRDEETLLAAEDDPELFNATVVWPDKVKINLEYVEGMSFRKDLVYIMRTLIG